MNSSTSVSPEVLHRRGEGSWVPSGLLPALPIISHTPTIFLSTINPEAPFLADFAHKEPDWTIARWSLPDANRSKYHPTFERIPTYVPPRTLRLSRSTRVLAVLDVTAKGTDFLFLAPNFAPEAKFPGALPRQVSFVFFFHIRRQVA